MEKTDSMNIQDVIFSRISVRAYQPEPASLDDTLLPPLSHCWKEALPLLRQFSMDAARPCQAVLEALAKFDSKPQATCPAT